jgi:3-phenylpropionate/trans-cinnamate dioxygenase ferredoxin subunit
MELVKENILTKKADNWVYALEDKALSENQMMPSYPMGVNIVLARVGGAVYAISGMCVHMSCPLFTGKLTGYIITCPCHDWHFDIRTGKFLDAPELCLSVYSTKSDDGKLFINIK